MDALFGVNKVTGCMIPLIPHSGNYGMESRLALAEVKYDGDGVTIKGLHKKTSVVMGLVCVLVTVVITQTRTREINMSNVGNVTRFNCK